jgi:hypothetical protein
MMLLFPDGIGAAVGVLSRETGEGDRREAVEGAATTTESSPAPSTMLRMVPE